MLARCLLIFLRSFYGAAEALCRQKFQVADLPAKGLMRMFGYRCPATAFLILFCELFPAPALVPVNSLASASAW